MRALHRMDTTRDADGITATCTCGGWAASRRYDAPANTLRNAHREHQRTAPPVTFLLTACTTTDDRIVRDVTIVAIDAQPLNCGCTRITGRRPGPDDGPNSRDVQFLTDCCGWHTRNDPQSAVARRTA